MTSRSLPGLALAAVLALSACAGGTGGGGATTPEPPPGTGPVDASTAPSQAIAPQTVVPETVAPQAMAPSPDPSALAPPGSVTEADLPTADDLQWSEEAEWREQETSTGGGTEQLSVCQHTSMESLGADAIVARTFTLGEGGEAVSVAMGFTDRDLADQAYATVSDWIDDCEAVLAAQDRVDGEQQIPVTPVQLPTGRGQVTEWSYRAGAGTGELESQGLVQVDDRVNLTVMRVQGQDNDWDLNPGGPVGAVHPMIRSLPAIAERLAR